MCSICSSFTSCCYGCGLNDLLKTIHSVEHCTLHAGYIALAYLIGIIKLYLLPLCLQKMEEVVFHCNLQFPINLKWYECKTSFEFCNA